MYPVTLVRLSQRRMVRFELRDGSIVTGRLVKCDQAMNMRVEDAQLTAPNQQPQMLGSCVFRGPAVRMVAVDPAVLRKQYLFDQPSPMARERGKR